MIDFFGYALLNICPEFSLVKAEISVTSPRTLKVLNIILLLLCRNSLLTFYFVLSMAYAFDIHISHIYWMLFSQSILLYLSLLPVLIY